MSNWLNIAILWLLYVAWRKKWEERRDDNNKKSFPTLPSDSLFFSLWLWIAWFCLYTVAGSSSNDDSFHRTKLFFFMHKYMHGVSFKSAWQKCTLNIISLSCTCSGLFFVENFWWETERRCYLDGSGSSRWSGSFGSLKNEFYCWKLLEIYFIPLSIHLNPPVYLPTVYPKITKIYIYPSTINIDFHFQNKSTEKLKFTLQPTVNCTEHDDDNFVFATRHNRRRCLCRFCNWF